MAEYSQRKIVVGDPKLKAIKYKDHVLSLVQGHELPTFHTLIKLFLPCNKHSGLLLPMLLENSPNLDVLVSCEFKRPKMGDHSKFPTVSHHFKAVQILELDCQEEVL
ncbi:conserved hypothetical protein [Ricinus communis]|uniref:FBD domain-containing protein n=1 Tax=Ricinus communis TaxID=3988 RepID=B9SNN9_RICCO|nr:conserved hypothetical protein [Ricinus communis]